MEEAQSEANVAAQAITPGVCTQQVVHMTRMREGCKVRGHLTPGVHLGEALLNRYTTITTGIISVTCKL